MAKQLNRGRFVKGAPSPNPHGRAAPIAKRAAAAQASGSDGVISYGGYIETGEQSGQLVGHRKWVEYANAFQRPPVAIAAQLRNALLAGATWSLIENDAGGPDAARGVEIVQRGLLEARMPKPWPLVARKAAMSYFNGYSLQATALARRPDGLVTYTEISERPVHTIERWFRADATMPFDSVEQRLHTGEVYNISLDECFYCVDDTLSAAPTGTGMLRLIIERIRRSGIYETLEGSELFSGMGGTPIARAPLEELGRIATGDADAVRGFKQARTKSIASIVSDRVKTPDKRQYAVLDSATYQGSDPNTISGIKKWDIEIIKADIQGLPEIRKIIADCDLDSARMLGVEFAFVGGGDSSGSYGMHESKVGLFSAQLTADGNVIGVQATQQLARRLIAANGLDPDTATPTIIMAPISTEDVLKTTQSLVQLNMAGLAPNHPAKIAMFDRLSLPWQDEPELALPRMPSPNVPPTAPAAPTAPGDRIEPAPEAAIAPRAGDAVAKAAPGHQETPYSCGAAALGYALVALGVDVDESKLRELSDTTDEGADEVQLGAALDALAIPYHDDHDASFLGLLAELEVGHSCVLSVDDWEHWVAVVGILGSRVVLRDPLNTPENVAANTVYMLTEAELVERWRGPDDRLYMMAITKEPTP